MSLGICERVPEAAARERDEQRDVEQAVRRRGYEEGLIAAGVPYVEAGRRARERYP